MDIKLQGRLSVPRKPALQIYDIGPGDASRRQSSKHFIDLIETFVLFRPPAPATIHNITLNCRVEPSRSRTVSRYTPAGSSAVGTEGVKDVRTKSPRKLYT